MLPSFGGYSLENLTTFLSQNNNNNNQLYFLLHALKAFNEQDKSHSLETLNLVQAPSKPPPST